jgi:hypothetical protein
MDNGKFWHPPCCVVALSEFPFTGAPFDQLRKKEDAILAKGHKLRIVVYDLPEPVIGIAMFKAKQRQPSEEQLARIYRKTCEFRATMSAPIGGKA